jgi:hypothetical protein
VTTFGNIEGTLGQQMDMTQPISKMTYYQNEVEAQDEEQERYREGRASEFTVKVSETRTDGVKTPA